MLPFFSVLKGKYLVDGGSLSQNRGSGRLCLPSASHNSAADSGLLLFLLLETLYSSSRKTGREQRRTLPDTPTTAAFRPTLLPTIAWSVGLRPPQTLNYGGTSCKQEVSWGCFPSLYPFECLSGWKTQLIWAVVIEDVFKSWRPVGTSNCSKDVRRMGSERRFGI